MGVRIGKMNFRRVVVQTEVVPTYDLRIVVQTTSDYKKTGIYSALINDTSKPITIDWGDGNVEEVQGRVSQKTHEYASVGIFNVLVWNVITYVASFSTSSNPTWYNTTSQNKYTLKEVNILNVPNIGNYAFQSCTNLTNVTLSNNVMDFGQHAFDGCSGLTSITLPNNITGLPNYLLNECSNLTNVTLGDNVSTIGSFALADCSSLTSITIPDSVTSIGSGAFYGCSGLTNIIIPNNVTSIGSQAFYGCTGLANITIGTGVTRINANAFNGCTNCTIYDFSTATQVPTLQRVNAFQNTNANKKIIVPDALYDSWIAASNWSSTTNGIVTSIVRASDFNNQ